jgi:hypothetical protein
MLKRSAFFNSLWTVVGNGGQLAVSLGTFLYLARCRPATSASWPWPPPSSTC